MEDKKAKAVVDVMAAKRKKVVEQLKTMQDGAQCHIDNGLNLYVMHATCAVEFAENALFVLSGNDKPKTAKERAVYILQHLDEERFNRVLQEIEQSENAILEHIGKLTRNSTTDYNKWQIEHTALDKVRRQKLTVLYEVLIGKRETLYDSPIVKGVNV